MSSAERALGGPEIEVVAKASRRRFTLDWKTPTTCIPAWPSNASPPAPPCSLWPMRHIRRLSRIDRWIAYANSIVEE
jgi:hypothetical protein